MQKPRNYARRTFLASIATAAVSLNGCSNHAELGGPAPSVKFKTLKNEQPIDLAALSKPLLVNFWSTSCGVCIKEMPHLAKLYAQFKPKGFEMVAVAMSYDRPSDVLEMSEARKWPFLVALDLDSSVSKAFGKVQFTPTSFLIDQDGNVAEKAVGEIDIKKLAQVLTSMINT